MGNKCLGKIKEPVDLAFIAIVMSHTYREQYDRMMRWFSKLQQINQHERLANAKIEEIMDEITAFFQNCYHLKDWIEKDPTTSAKLASSGIDIDHNLINTDIDMKLLADLCNGSKHMTLLWKNGVLGRSGQNPKFPTGQAFKVTIGSTAKVNVDWRIKTEDGTEYSVIELATRCIQKWDNFINTYL